MRDLTGKRIACCSTINVTVIKGNLKKSNLSSDRNVLLCTQLTGTYKSLYLTSLINISMFC